MYFKIECWRKLDMENNIFGFDTKKSWDYENGFYLTSHTSRLSKAVYHWELYKMVHNVPGDIVEVGTYKGASLIRFLSFREISESQYGRKVISFDAFGKFPKTGRKYDDKFIDGFEEDGGYGISKTELDTALKHKGYTNYELVEGNIFDTLEPYLEKNNQMKIALLHLDVDVYDATLHALNLLFPHISRGGALVLDDYNAVEGATNAADEYIKNNSISESLQKLSFSFRPSFLIKK